MPRPPIDEFLDTPLDIPDASSSSILDQPINNWGEVDKKIEVIQLEEGQTDPRLKFLSHSSRTLLHKCPRKYQLYRLSSKEADQVDNIKGVERGVTFSFGTAVGVGIQAIMAGATEDQAILQTFLAWEDADLLESNQRQKKSIWSAIFAVQKFYALREQGILEQYDLVYYEGRPAVELSFIISLPNGFYYRGFVDVVLVHRVTGEILVLELKTASSTAQPAQYKNSGQALGYSVILDKLFPEMSSYTVLYLVYETKSYEYKQLPYNKSLYQRAVWLQELLIDTQVIDLYDSYDVYPQHGESCYDFFTDCEYLGLCGMETEHLTTPYTTADKERLDEELEKYDFFIEFEDLVQSQIEKGEL